MIKLSLWPTKRVILSADEDIGGGATPSWLGTAGAPGRILPVHSVEHVEPFKIDPKPLAMVKGHREVLGDAPIQPLVAKASVPA